MLRPIAEIFDPSNINVMELWPIVVGLKRWANVLKNQSVMVFTDNTQVMYMLLNGRSINRICMKLFGYVQFITLNFYHVIYLLLQTYLLILCREFLILMKLMN